MGEAGIILNVDILSTLQEDPDVLEEWAHKNLVKLSKDKCKVLHLGKQSRSTAQAGTDPAGKQLWGRSPGGAGGHQARGSDQCGESDQMCGRDPVGGWAASTGASPTDGEVIVPLHPAFVRSHLE